MTTHEDCRETLVNVDTVLYVYKTDSCNKYSWKNYITGKSLSGGPPMSNVVLVYFLGGCTYSEITALRFLGKVKGILTNIHFVNSIVLYSHTRDFCLAPAF